MKSIILFSASVIALLLAVAVIFATIGTYIVYLGFMLVFIALCLFGAAVEQSGKEVSHE